MELDYQGIGKRVRQYRKEAGLSQEKLAEMIDISITHMSHIETANTKLSLPVLAALSKALEVSADELIFGVSYAANENAIGRFSYAVRECDEKEAENLVKVMEYIKTVLLRK